MGLTLVQRKAVTKAIATRYRRADRAGKGRILDELCATTGWHRNHARKALGQALQGADRQTTRSSPTQVRTGCRCGAGVLLGGAGHAGG